MAALPLVPVLSRADTRENTRHAGEAVLRLKGRIAIVFLEECLPVRLRRARAEDVFIIENVV